MINIHTYTPKLTHLSCSSLQDVLSTPPIDHRTSDVRSATFYSVTSTQRGLDGIGLGNLLIKRVVEQLRAEFNNIEHFVTLSPIPGFAKWLDAELTAVEQNTAVPEKLRNVTPNGVEGLLTLKKQLATPDWHTNTALCELMRRPLTLLCVRYLLTKRRGFCVNPVAHFHLRNGASLWRINWMGNTNAHGLKSSCGLMVNYKYDLSLLETNNSVYVTTGGVCVSDSVQEYLDALDG